MTALLDMFGPHSAWAVLIPWFPLILKGFWLNILISVLAMAIGIVTGAALGALQMSKVRLIVLPARVLTLFLRNSPWLVIVFYVMYLMPFEIRVGSQWISFPDWVKAVVAFSLPVTGYISEIVRGGMRAVPTTQWEAAEALAFGPARTVFSIILPQAFKQMLPPTMNLYCSVAMATSLANIVGVQEVITITQTILTTETRPGLILPAYGITLALFFVYVFPISLLSRQLERVWSKGLQR
ncbi:amino acid ABC transporter permease [Chelatococcus asaccharovorans]|uniref:Amino acid ABC transporter membrane protein 2 (PAAT family) n=1 Tax=Chelatococcus asaccharovorans TaxID=28210 RepID=A0A2V3UL34_9HYPH|nr:amino acid ABC transporter permease [Chelatococcus asaccharovorans]MBS7706343.1 amino acid ABC transporter permease [Chelatococcus asaccharovorans]PXW65014.1 amino acid ABC transporter membrane protein 2 (PAAT family) [Chelatococcus asaccharovorans]CAH1661257.1 Amino acid ABC transporter membrane protein 2 (PAAT family) [Chelatococcus asaccharovorans]CAH1683531.1 Amino acid ABC transporter membrane protein 2 (PAAT family) [Chelatococcus asaccharovorans]